MITINTFVKLRHQHIAVDILCNILVLQVLDNRLEILW